MIPSVALVCGLVSSIVINGLLSSTGPRSSERPADPGKVVATADSAKPASVSTASDTSKESIEPLGLANTGNQSQPTGGRLVAFTSFDMREVEDSIHLLKASRLFTKQEFKKAQLEVDAVSPQSRKSNVSYLTLASECYMANNQPDLAMKAAQEMIALEPSGYNGYLQRAKVLKQQKKYREAIADFQTAYKLFDGFKGKFGNRLSGEMESKMSGVMRSVFIQQVGACYELMGDAKEATKQYERGVTLATKYPPGVVAPVKLSAEQIATMKKELLSLDEAVQRMPESLAFRLRRGAVLKALGLHQAAVADYTKAISVASGDPFQIYYERAGAFYALGKYKLSAHDMRKVFRDDPLDPLAAIKARGSMAAASIPTPSLKSIKTIRALDLAIEKNPDKAENYFRRGCARIAFHQYTPAKEDFETFLSLSSGAANNEALAHTCVLVAMCHDVSHPHTSLAKEVVASVSSFGSEKWLYEIYMFVLGKKTEQELLKEAGADRYKLTQANYYIGQHYVARDDAAKARNYFNAAVAAGDKSCDEYFLSKLALIPELAYFAESSGKPLQLY